MASDIGEVIFVEILKMSQYPGYPFTGNIINDLIMFLFVPSVFIILFIYMILGRLFSIAQGKLKLLVGIAMYLFIIAGGYYSFFALLAGPYFIVLIFVLGTLYFVFGHFGVRRGHTMPGHALSGRAGGEIENMDRKDLLYRKDLLKKSIARTEEEIRRAEKNPVGEKEIERLRSRKLELHDELDEVEEALKFVNVRVG